ncbi:hypothetical protein AVEN_85882-1 [Araneus ventricosus]|uniref:Uncharacterized protein n=1 Tax=Araneus ventricosus TaxID=182803 RepID=A0A4Y2TWH0_ARAVE|nr:hypothetical protein AVEN_85882-1 [Araneus ventricosus]
MKFGANGLEVVEFKRTQNPKLHPPIPIWDLDVRLAGEQRICLHWHLASRLEMKFGIPRVGEEEIGERNSATFNLASKQTLKRP